MSVEYFAALEGEIPVVEAERSLRLADAVMYPHLSLEHAQRWWSRTAAAITRARAEVNLRAGALFTVDGQAVGVAGLKKWFRQTVGKGLAA